jgi:ABC-type multidrug transport system fused ATPase/permease subunit
LAGVQILFTFIMISLRNKGFEFYMMFGVHVRRTINYALFQKCSKISIKSLAESSSGKLINLVSADLFQVDNGLMFSGLIIAAPLLNIVVYAIIAYLYDFRYSLVVFGIALI